MKHLTCSSILILFLAAAAAPAVAQERVPTPQSVIGWEPCADAKLANYEKIADYFHKLDAASERMQLFEIGKTAEGRTQLMAIISAEQNMANLARYKEISRRLARARDLTDEQARSLAREGKAVVWIDFGLHSTEVAHGQTAPWMAYKAITEESEEMRHIRDNVIFILIPNMNPDGTTLVADWFMKNVGTPYERSSPPALYHKYVGHDNNRDWYMFNMPESRNIARQLYVEWFPQIVYNQHQTGPFPARIFIPPFADPMNPNIPALVMRGINLVGGAMSRRFSQEGKKGVISRIQYDTWWNGGMRSAPYYHNMVGILTETQHNSPFPAVYDPKLFPKTFNNGVSTLEPSTYYPDPFMGGEWHLRNSCEYMVIGSMAVLDIGAKRREEWLYDIYQMGRDAIASGRNETYVVSAAQRDRGAAVRMINTLRWGGVEIERSTSAFTAGGKSYPSGSWLIRGAQPFRAYLSDLLNPQVYPDMRLYPGGPPLRPYDITGWTLPVQMGVNIDRIAAAVNAATAPVEWAEPADSSVPAGAGFGWALDPRTNEAFIAVNRLTRRNVNVLRSSQPVSLGGAEWPAGTFIVTAAPGAQALLEEAVRGLGLEAAALDRAPGTEMWKLKSPRLGLYQAWGGNMDEGWTRWLLEQYEFPYTTLHDSDIRAGNLRSRFDVILLPDDSYESMLRGLEPGSMPPEYTGGMTARGVAALYEFASAGGTLVTMDQACELPLAAFGLAARNVTANLPSSEFYIPGTLLRLRVRPSHPVAYGMPEEAAAFFSHSQAFALGPRPGRPDGLPRRESIPQGLSVVAEYPATGLLVSGWLMGERVIANRAAVVEAKIDSGRVVMLGFRTQHRGQTHGTFKLLFNSILLGAAEKGSASN